MKHVHGKLYLKLKGSKWYERKRFTIELTLETGDILILPMNKLREIIAKEEKK